MIHPEECEEGGAGRGAHRRAVAVQGRGDSPMHVRGGGRQELVSELIILFAVSSKNLRNLIFPLFSLKGLGDPNFCLNIFF